MAMPLLFALVLLVYPDQDGAWHYWCFRKWGQDDLGVSPPARLQVYGHTAVDAK